MTFVMEDFNAKAGNGRESGTVGHYGLGEQNDRGQACLCRLVPRQQLGDFSMVSKSQETPLDMAQFFTYNKKSD